MKTGIVDWAVKTVAKEGETQSGDTYVVKEIPDGVIVAVIDGLGHGEEAARSAVRAAEVIERNSQQSLISIIHQCHQSLANERGAVMSVVKLDNSRTLSWIGVGNVEVKLFHRADQSVKRPVLTAGVVGWGRLPTVYAASVPVRQGDVLILSTDGVGLGFADKVNTSAGPEQIAADIMDSFVKHTDDALILVCRYLN